MDIGSVLSRAWQIIWKHKVLWLFGILAGCASGNNGTSNLRVSEERPVPPQVQNFFNQLSQTEVFLLVAGIILAVLVLVVIVTFIGTIGRIGLIRGAREADAGAVKLTFGELFQASLPYFWRVLILNLLIGLATALIIVLLVVFTIVGAVATLGILALCMIPFFCLLVPLTWLLNVVVEQANIAIVVENLGVMDGLRRGWQVFTRNLGTMIVMALILGLGVGLIGGFLIGWPLALALGPLLLGAIAGNGQYFGGSLLVTGLCLVGYLPVLIVLSGILRSYIDTAWTLTFLRLTNPATPSAPIPTAVVEG